MNSLKVYKKFELTVAIIYVLILILASSFMMNLSSVLFKIVGFIVLAIFSFWVGHFLRKKKKEAKEAEQNNHQLKV
ncbi:hypothetical protein [Oceanobacillus sp. CAU 1775]